MLRQTNAKRYTGSNKPTSILEKRFNVPTRCFQLHNVSFRHRLVALRQPHREAPLASSTDNDIFCSY